MRKVKDTILNIFTYVASSLSVIILIAIFIFIFKNGIHHLSFKLIVSDYTPKTYALSSQDYVRTPFIAPSNLDASIAFSTYYGIGLKDSTTIDGEPCVEVSYMDSMSPMKSLFDKGSNGTFELQCGNTISKIILEKEEGGALYLVAAQGAQSMASMMDNNTIITDMVVNVGGGGIRGSLISTLYLILLTLVISLPIGICAAIYLHEYAPNNRLTNTIRGMIDTVAGIPSIIFGLVGAIIFIPVLNKTIGSTGGSIASGALTMTMMLLPTIIKTTEEALIVIPESYRQASLGLGASKSQTVWHVVLPNAIPGILTATLLSIGRIIGESAALIYAVGTAIKDSIHLNDKSTTLAVHIWSLMSGEHPNFETSCSISIIILCLVLVLNLMVKLISKKLNKEVVK